MSLLSTVRSQEILNPQEHGTVPITVIGVGATGSHLVMSLVELGFTNIRCYDPDVVEEHNLNNQAYEYKDIGQPKVEALGRLIKEKTGGPLPDTIKMINGAVTKDIVIDGVVFLLTDTMASRKDIAECFKNIGVIYVIETRMASSYGNVFGFDPKSELDDWINTLSDDETTEVSACGSPISVGPTAKLTANLAVWHLINWLVDPLAVDQRLDFYLKPATFAFKKLAD